VRIRCVDSHQGVCKWYEDQLKILDSGRDLAVCGGLMGSLLVWRAQGRLDLGKDRVGFI
jgi:hypothetical protein